MKILIVEPTKLYLQILETIANDAGAEIVSAASGADGLTKLSEHSFDLICLSHQLGDMESTNFMAGLPAEYITKNVRTVLLTSSQNEILQASSIKAGFTEVLPKDNFDSLQRGLTSLIQSNKTLLMGKVLYAEDSQSVAALTIHLLQEMGLEVDHFINGNDTLKAFTKNKYDLVITDMVLEGNLTGLSIVNAVREVEPESARMPILVMSGNEDITRRVELLRQGANDYVSKPVEEEEFKVRVRNLVITKQLFDRVEQQQKKLYEMAITDSLTGLHNRHMLGEIATKYVSAAYRKKEPLSLLVVDLDHFKLVNDTHGHATGDIVLSEVGELLKNRFRNEDVAARFGGEEFVILMQNCPPEAARLKAEQLRIAIENLKPAELPISSSIGLSTLPLAFIVDFDKLFHGADEAVYVAKDNGRNQVRVYTGDFE